MFKVCGRSHFKSLISLKTFKLKNREKQDNRKTLAFPSTGVTTICLSFKRYLIFLHRDNDCLNITEVLSELKVLSGYFLKSVVKIF